MEQTNPLQQPLSIEELETLDIFLNEEDIPEGSIASIDMLDGFMTALVVGPEPVMPEEWMPWIWNQEDDETGRADVFASDAEAEIIEALLLRHMNSIMLQFEEEPDEFLPLFEKLNYEDDESLELAVEDWALGFLMGMEMTHDAWKPLFDDDEVAVIAVPIFILSKMLDEHENIKDEEIQSASEHITDSIIGMYEFWRRRQ